VIGSHGCDQEVGARILSGETDFKTKENFWNWLGLAVMLFFGPSSRDDFLIRVCVEGATDESLSIDGDCAFAGLSFEH
jgi:hypothetical protein